VKVCIQEKKKFGQYLMINEYINRIKDHKNINC